jgi:hypothetical protein
MTTIIRVFIQRLSRPPIPRNRQLIIITIRGSTVIDKEIAFTVIITKLSIICQAAIAARFEIIILTILVNQILYELSSHKMSVAWYKMRCR